MNPLAWRTDRSVASASRERTCSWFAGSTVKTLMIVTRLSFLEIVITVWLRMVMLVIIIMRMVSCRQSGSPPATTERSKGHHPGIPKYGTTVDRFGSSQISEKPNIEFSCRPESATRSEFHRPAHFRTKDAPRRTTATTCYVAPNKDSPASCSHQLSPQQKEYPGVRSAPFSRRRARKTCQWPHARTCRLQQSPWLRPMA